MANQARVLPFSARRQVLPTLDLRTSAQREGVTGLQQSAQAIAGILQTIGQAEQKRRERQTLDRVVRAIEGGATTAEAIAAAANQPAGFGTGIQGVLQKIGGAFQPQGGGGGIGQNILQTIIGQKLQQALAPKPEIPAGLEPSGVTVGPKGGVTTIFGVPKAVKPTKIQELINEGYTREEARMIRDISHGLKPRASARKQYENMGDVEKRDFLSKLRQRAEGQYFGIDPELGGLKEPRQPKLLKWVEQEEAKLEKTQTKDVTEPQTQEEFIEKVKSIEDATEARAYYDKWAGKWR